MVKVKKNIKKAFYEVAVPMTSTKVSLYAGSSEELVGKVIKLDLTRSLKGKSLELKFKVKNDGEKLIGEPTKMELVGSYIRKMMRTGTDYVEDSFVAECKDGKAIVKPFLITRNKVSRSVRNALRNEARKFLEGHLRARNIRDIFSEMTANRVQREMSLRLKKIYPLALCEIRVFEVSN